MRRKRRWISPPLATWLYTHKKHRTLREKFLERLEGLVPWQRLEARIEPHYPKAGRGLRPYGVVGVGPMLCR